MSQAISLFNRLGILAFWLFFLYVWIYSSFCQSPWQELLLGMVFNNYFNLSQAISLFNRLGILAFWLLFLYVSIYSSFVQSPWQELLFYYCCSKSPAESDFVGEMVGAASEAEKRLERHVWSMFRQGFQVPRGISFGRRNGQCSLGGRKSSRKACLEHVSARFPDGPPRKPIFSSKH